MKVIRSLFILLFLILPEVSLASSSTGLVYHGRIVKPNGEALNTGMVNFIVSIVNSNSPSCILWSESFSNVSMVGKLGTFELLIGMGTPVYTGGQTLDQVFRNSGNLTCFGGAPYAVGSDDDRSLVVSFNDGSGSNTLPAMAIRSAPWALQAHQITGYGIRNLFKIGGLPGTQSVFSIGQHDVLYNFSAMKDSVGVACGAGEILKVVGGSWQCATDDGGAGVVTSVTASSPLSVSGTTTIDVGLIPGSIAGDTLRWTGANWGVGQLGIADISGVVPVNRGGTGITTAPADGQILIGGGSGYVAANLAAGANISIVNSSGAITINAAVSPGVVSSVGLADQVAIYAPGTGALTGESQLSPLRGGTGSGVAPVSGAILVGTGDGNYAPTIISSGSGINITAVSGAMTIGVNGWANLISGAGTSNYLAMFNGPKSVVSSPVYVSPTGDVGIGTTSPLSYGGNYKVLDVRGGSTTEGGILSVGNSDNSVYGQFGMSGAGPGINLKSVSNHPIFFGTNNTERMRLDASGNLTVGTTSNANGLTPLNSKAVIRNSAGANVLSLESGVSGGPVNLDFDGLASNGLQSGSRVRLSQLQSGVGWDSIFTISLGGGGTLNERMRIESSGNVGIGTNSPTSKIHATLSSNAASSLMKIENSSTGASATTQLDILNTNKTASIIYYSANHSTKPDSLEIVTPPAAAGAIIINPQGVTASTRIYGNNTERVRIDSAGNVGIGTAAPSSILDISGAQTFRGLATAPANAPVDQARIYYDTVSDKLMYSVNSNGYQEIATTSGMSGNFVAKTGDTMTGSLAIAVSGPAAGLTVTQSGSGHAATFMGGNVGVDTSSPSSKLHVSATGAPGGILIDRGAVNDSAAPGLKLTSSSLGWGSGIILENSTAIAGRTYGMYSAGDGKFHISDQSAGVSRVSLDSSGNVGIGTTSPGAKADVRGQLFVYDYITDANVGLKMYGSADVIGAGKTTYIDTTVVPGQVDTNLRFKTTGYFDFVGYAISSIPNIFSAGNIGFRNSSIVRWDGATLTGGTGLPLSISTYYGTNFSKTNNSVGPTVAIKKYTGQSNSLFEWQDTNGSVLGLINSSGNMGIGLTAPTAKLHLPAGTSAAGTAPLKFDPTAATLMTVADNGAMEFDGADYYLTAGGLRKKIMTNSSASGGVSGSGTTNYLPKFSGSSALTDSILYENGTNVGVGTALPGAKLEVAGTIMMSNGVGNNIKLSNSTFAASLTYDSINNEMTIGNEGGNTNLYLHSGGGLAVGGIVNPGPNGLAIVGNAGFGGNVESGRVGITPSTRTIATGSAWTAGQPGYSLNVRGGACGPGTDLNGGDLELSSGDSRGTGTSKITLSTATAGASGTGQNIPSAKMTILGNGNVGIGVGTPTFKFESNGSFKLFQSANTFLTGQSWDSLDMSAGNGLIINNVSNNGIDIQTSGTSRLKVDQAGNVGIGTANPGSLLSVQNSSGAAQIDIGHFNSATGATLKLMETSGSGRFLSLNQSNSNKGTLRVGTDNNQSGAGSTAFVVNINDYANSGAVTRDLFEIQNGGVQKFLVTSAGNVGIGTTSPLVPLHVSGAFGLQTIQNAPALAAGLSQIYAASSGKIRVSENGGAWSDLATSSGVSASYVAKAGDSMTGALGITISGAPTAISVVQGGAGYAATFMGGNVGVGTTTPTALLELVDPSAATKGLRIKAFGGSSANLIEVVDAGNGPLFSVERVNGTTINGILTLGSGSADGAIISAGTGVNKTIQSYGGKAIEINPAGNNVLLATGGGNVGIGTTTPASNARLAIKDGHLQAQQTTAPSISGTNCGLLNATDIAGMVTLGVGGQTCIVTFNKSFSVAPIVTVTPCNAAAGYTAANSGAPYAVATTTAVTIGYYNVPDLTLGANNICYHLIETQ